VTRFGREDGSASGADAVLIAVPGTALADALAKTEGLDGKTVIDATNLVDAAPPSGFGSNAEFVRSLTNGPTAKAFNLNFAAVYDRIAAARERPANLWCGDDEARAIVEQLNRDAGYEPVYAGPLANAGMLERALPLLFAISRGGLGPFFYTMAPADRL
jgi:predicted dinucleotide-binding enzyme